MSTSDIPGALPLVEVEEGPSFLLIGLKDGSTISRSPFSLRRALDILCPDLLDAKVVRSGRVLVRTRDAAQTRRLLALTEFDGQPAEAALADRLNSCEGVIYCPDLDSESDQSILAELDSQGVTEVHRLRSKSDKPNPLIKLRFRGKTLPSKVRCGYLSVTVKPWLNLPTQCRRCWKHGHSDRACRHQDEVCGFCSAANDHPTNQCPAPQPSCPVCSERHPAWDRNNCGVWRDIKQKAQEQAQPSQPPPESMGPAWPALPSPPRPSVASQPFVAQTVDSGSQTDDPPAVQPPLTKVSSCQTDAPPEAPPTSTAETQTTLPTGGKAACTQTPTRRFKVKGVQTSSAATTTTAAQTESSSLTGNPPEAPSTSTAETQTTTPSAATTTSAAQTDTPTQATADAGTQYTAPRIRIYSTTSESTPSSPGSVASYRSGPVTRSAAAAASRPTSERDTPSPCPSEAEDIVEPARVISPYRSRPARWVYPDGTPCAEDLRFLHDAWNRKFPFLEVIERDWERARRGYYRTAENRMVYLQ